MKRLLAFAVLSSLILAACSAAGTENTPTPDGSVAMTSAYSTAFAILTQTAQAGPPTATAVPTDTPVPPTASLTPTTALTVEPVVGIAHSPVTVRADTSKGSANLGGVYGNQSVQILARDQSAGWYYIQWAKSPTGTAWVTARAIDLKGGIEVSQLPVAIYDASHNIVLLPPPTWVISGTPLPIPAPAAGANTASVNQLGKVRIGPGLGYSAMGTVDFGVTVTLTGRLFDNSWFQIIYPSGPNGKGWLAADIIHPNGLLAGLQFYNILATPISDLEAKGGAFTPTLDPNASPAPTSTPAPTSAGPSGVVYHASEINVHSGPASMFDTIATLNSGDAVTVTGETLNKLWYRILYPSGPGGYGWVSTKYIRITGGSMETLPFFDNQGTPLP